MGWARKLRWAEPNLQCETRNRERTTVRISMKENALASDRLCLFSILVPQGDASSDPLLPRLPRNRAVRQSNQDTQTKALFNLFRGCKSL
jgi:hypothetical protein